MSEVKFIAGALSDWLDFVEGKSKEFESSSKIGELYTKRCQSMSGGKKLLSNEESKAQQKLENENASKLEQEAIARAKALDEEWTAKAAKEEVYAKEQMVLQEKAEKVSANAQKDQVKKLFQTLVTTKHSTLPSLIRTAFI